MRILGIAFAVCMAFPSLALAQGVIPTNNAAIFSAQPVQTPSGTTAGTLATRMEGRLDLVADFGADPTGVADISAALNAAIATGKPIYVPAGTYLLSGSVIETASNQIDLTCADPIATTINLSGTLGVSTGTTTAPRFSVEKCGITFSGSGNISLSQTNCCNSPQTAAYFDRNYFQVLGTSTANPAINLNTYSASSITNNFAQTNGSSTILFELSGNSINTQFVGNDFQNANATTGNTGVYLTGGTGAGIQGTRFVSNHIIGYGNDISIGSNVATVQLSNNMLDQGQKYALFVSGSNISDIRANNNYMVTVGAANSGLSGAYIGGASNVILADNFIGATNSGNYAVDLSTALTYNVVLSGNTVLNGGVYNPNNINLQQGSLGNGVSSFVSGTIGSFSSYVQGSNILLNQIDLSADASLTASQSGNYVYWTGGAGTITLPSSGAFGYVGAGVFYIQNNGTAPVNILTVATDHNFIPGAATALGGSAPLPVGAGFVVYTNPGGPGWAAQNYNSTNLVIPTTATINGIPVGITPSVATLGTNPPVSGTAYQWGGPGTLQLACPITYSPTSTAAATSALDIGSTSTPSSAVDTESEPAGITAGMIHTAHAEVPAGWYYELTVTNATIGTCVGIVH